MFAAELFDQLSGFSQVFSQPGPQQLPGDPATFSLMGVAFGEVLRLNAVAVNPGPTQSPTAATVAPGPCVVTLGFVDAAGVQVGPGPIQITLNPGEGGFLDLPAVQLVSRFGRRALVRPTVMVESMAGADACAGVASAAELFDVFGHTWAASTPSLTGEQPMPTATVLQELQGIASDIGLLRSALDAVVVQVQSNPGPIQDPAAQAALATISTAAAAIANDLTQIQAAGGPGGLPVP